MYALKHHVALYARVSTPGQAERDLSVPDQLGALRKYCKDKGWSIAGEYTDKGKSGGKVAGREAFSLMLQAALRKNPPFTLILTRDASRFGRGDEDPGLRAKLRKNGVSVDNIESPVGDMFGEMTNQQKQNERFKWVMDVGQREEIAPRVIASQKRAASEGRFPGASGTVYGYKQVYVGDGRLRKRTVEPDPINAKIVAEMFRLYADGGSLHSVTRWLNEIGAPTPKIAKRWYEATVRRILRNETVLGDIIYGRLKTTENPETQKPRYVKSDKDPVRFENAFPALVSRELFDAVQARLDKNERRRPKAGHPGNLVRAIAVCAHCGWGLAFQQRRGKWYYLCETKKQKAAKADAECCGTLPAMHMHAVVFDFLKRHVSIPHYREVLKEAVRVYNKAATEHQGLPEIEIVADQIKELERRRDNLVKAIANGIDSSAVEDELHETELKLSVLRKKRDEIIIALRSIPKLDEQHILDVARGLRSAINASDMPKIKEFLGSVVSRIEVDFTKRKMREVTFNIKSAEPSFQELMETQFPGVKIASLDQLDEEAYKAMGGREHVKKVVASLQRTDEEVLREIAPQIMAMRKLDLKAARLGVRIEQRVEQGRRITVLSKGAPLTFIAKWDAANLDRLSAEALRKIGSIAV